MVYRIGYVTLLAWAVMFCCVESSLAADSDVALATYQVPDLAAPQLPSPAAPDRDPVDLGEPLPAPLNPLVDDPTVDPPSANPRTVEEYVVPMPSVYPDYGGTTVSLFDTPPVPYPGAELWAGRYGSEETLQPRECPPAWASVDVLWLQRDDPRDALLATDGNLATLRNANFEFDYEAGVRIVYGEVVNCIPIEITYFGTHDWNSTIALDGPNLQVPVGPLGGVFDRVEARYRSELHSLELNVLKFDSCHLTWMAGVRYVDADEDFRLLADGVADGLVAVDTENRLLGGQAGVGWNYCSGDWQLGATGKAGLYVNFAERDRLVNDPLALPVGPPRERHENELAFVGQLQLGVARHIAGGVKLRAGYELMWLDGLALASEQLGNGAPAQPVLNTNGSVFYDGGYVGLEWQR